MALLLNRKYGSRLECLYYILKSIYKKFDIDKSFSLNDFKFDENDKENVHNYCQLLKWCINQNCCRFLDNPLDPSKCYATQSVNSDSTKSKAVSDVGGSLEALGFITKEDNGLYKVSSTGKQWVETDFYSKEWGTLAQKAVLSYGPLVGFLSKLKDKADIFSYSGIYLGYPKTEEIVQYTDENGLTKTIHLSTDSQKDSNTRTVSKIIAWCVCTGILYPQTQSGINLNETLPHLKYQDFINQERLTVRRFEKSETVKHLFDTKFLVNNPLSFSRLHKNVGSIRENGSEDLRNATLENIPKILNRRYVFIKVLNYCSKNNISLDFEKLVDAMEKQSKFFFSAGNNAFDIMASECEIADIAGIPFSETDDGLLVPLTIINEEVLEEDVTDEAKNLATLIIKDMFT